MASFPLKIVTSEGLRFDGEAEMLLVRTTDGDMAVMAQHINCIASIGIGRAEVVTNGHRRAAACNGGMLKVTDGSVTLMPMTFEWAEDIDKARAEASYERAKQILAEGKDAAQIAKAQARLHRALIRKNVATEKQL